MKTKHLIYAIPFLITLGTIAFWVVQIEAQTTTDSWEAWVDEQTDTVLKSAGEMDAEQRAEMHAKIREKFSVLAAELKNEIASPPPAQDYAILQTVKELRATYDAGYNHKHKDTTVRVSYTIGDTEILAYDENVPLTEVDAKYPRDEWLQMLLDKDITIKNADEYWKYLFLRDTLVHLERQQHVWTSGLFDIPPTADWETYKAAYIERELGQIQKRLEKEKLPRVLNFEATLKEYHNLLGKKPVPGEVFRSLQDFPKEAPQIEFKKHIIIVPQSVKSLRDAYDEKYNERYAITSGSVSYTLNNGTIFKYKVPLPLSEVDAKYPRDEWLQMLLDKRIKIDNFEEYWTYLSKRDELMALEKHPEVWSSKLFGIAPTEDWETYKAAYLEQMLKKFDSGKQDTIYFGKAGPEETLKRSREIIEKLEQSKPWLLDR